MFARIYNQESFLASMLILLYYIYTLVERGVCYNILLSVKNLN